MRPPTFGTPAAGIAAVEQAQIEVQDEIDERALAAAELSGITADEWSEVRFGFVRAMRIATERSARTLVEACAAGLLTRIDRKPAYVDYDAASLLA